MKIVRLKNFRLTMQAMGFSQNDIAKISKSITAEREKWPIIPGLHGAQKARINLLNTSKRDGGRVIYYVAVGDMIFFIFAYPKSEQSDLTPEQRKAIIAVIKRIKNGGST